MVQEPKFVYMYIGHHNVKQVALVVLLLNDTDISVKSEF